MEEQPKKRDAGYVFWVKNKGNTMSTTVFFAVGLAIILLISYFVYSENYLASFLFLLVGGIFGASVFKKQAGSTKYIIRKEGVQIHTTLYPYEYLKSFWIFYDPPYQAEISFLSKKVLVGRIRVPFGEEDPAKLREFLIQFIPEKKQEESLADIFIKLLGF